MKNTKFLKKLKEVVGEAPPLSSMLHAHLRTQDMERPYDRIHASELTKENYCPKRLALKVKTNAPRGFRWLSTSENVTFDMGRKLQDSVVHWFSDMKRAFADWKCDSCGQMHSFVIRPEKCGTCGCRSLAPHEIRFKSSLSGASCGVDMLVKIGNAVKLRPVEIKTIDKDQFKALKMPQAEHRQRTTLYTRIIAEDTGPVSPYVDPSRAIILYVSKGGYGCAQDWLAQAPTFDKFSPFKEYEILRNDSEVEDLSKMAAEFTKFLDTGKMPCGICATAFSKTAQGCDMKNECWSGKFQE